MPGYQESCCVIAVEYVGENMNAAFDLTAVFEGYSIRDGKYVEIVRLLRNLEASRSKFNELNEAREQFEAADALGHWQDPKLGSRETAIIVEALFVHSIILYCRAAHSSSKARHNINILGALNASQKKTHLAITTLRDQVLAHYGKGESNPSGLWVNDRVVLQEREDEIFFSYPSMRAGHKAKMARELVELIEVGLAYLERYSQKKVGELADLLRPLLTTSEFRKLIEKHPFNELEFFGRTNTLGTARRLFVEEGEKPT